MHEAEALIHCKFFTFQHKDRDNYQFARCEAPYLVPAEVSEHLDFIGKSMLFLTG